MFAPTCSAAFARTGPQHPLQKVIVRYSEEIRGEDRDRMVLDILKRPDMQNVLQEIRVELDEREARVVVHILDTGNTLARPLAEREPGGRGYRSLYKSQAMFYTLEGTTVNLLSSSMNGQLIPLHQTALFSTCGNCTDIYNWTYYGAYCSSMDTGCAFRCCGACIVPCGSRNLLACLLCVGVWCPLCMASCCTTWSWGCVSCGAAP